MIVVRNSNSRGFAHHGWLESHHTFSFAEYYDPDFMGFGHLRVLNEDKVAPERGFSEHPHRDMEIISYVVSGELGHRDSMGNGSILRVGDVQTMTAGTGVRHSEWNPSKTQVGHFLQIWITPERRGLTPSYGQRTFNEQEKLNRWCVLASGDGRASSLKINQDAVVLATILTEHSRSKYQVKAGRQIWVQMVRGEIQLRSFVLRAGDGAAVIRNEDLGEEVEFIALKESEFLIFDLLSLPNSEGT